MKKRYLLYIIIYMQKSFSCNAENKHAKVTNYASKLLYASTEK